MPTKKSAETPPPPDTDETDDGDGTEDEDDGAEQFAQEWEAMRDKLARIPDDIGEKLDRLLSGKLGSGKTIGNIGGEASARASAQVGNKRSNPYPIGSERGAGSLSEGDTRPETRHWYYRKWGRDK